MESTLGTLFLQADEAELCELIGIADGLNSSDPNFEDLICWLLSWARGEWGTIIDRPADAGKLNNAKTATPQRVIGYFKAYLQGER